VAGVAPRRSNVPALRACRRTEARAEHEVEHAARPKGDLGVAGPHATLADERRLLVADERGDGRRARQRTRFADDPARVDDLRQHRGGNVEELERAGIPGGGVGEDLEPGHGCVGRVRDVDRAF
jgi:hypothetical protein